MPVTIRMLAGVLALTAVIGVAGPAQAKLSQEWTWCANKRGASRDLQINGCNTVIQFGNKSNSDHAIAFNSRGIAIPLKASTTASS